MIRSFCKSVLVSNFCKFSAQRSLRARAAFNLVVQVRDEHVIAEAAILSGARVDSEGGLRRALHNHDLFCSDGSAQAAIGFPKILADLQGLLYTYPFVTNNRARETMGSTFNSGFCVRNTCSVRVAGSVDNIMPRSGPAAYVSDFGAGKVKDKNIVEVPLDLVDKNPHATEFSVLSFDSRKCSSKEI